MVSVERREYIGELSKDIFEEFYRAVSLNNNYVLNLTKQDEVVLDRFLDYIDSRYKLQAVDSQFMINWIESGYNYWFDIPTRFGKGVVMFSWIFGKKAIERYEKIKDKDRQRFRYGRKIRKQVGIKIQTKYREKTKKGGSTSFYQKLALEPTVAEETIRAKHLNNEEGMIMCVQHTTLYNHKSSSCLQCKFSDQCKSILKENYPKIYKLRGYGESE